MDISLISDSFSTENDPRDYCLHQSDTLLSNDDKIIITICKNITLLYWKGHSWGAVRAVRLWFTAMATLGSINHLFFSLHASNEIRPEALSLSASAPNLSWTTLLHVI